MKLMRLLALLAACLFAMAAGAQQNPPAQESGEHKHGGQIGPGIWATWTITSKNFPPSSTSLQTSRPRSKSILEENHQKMQATMKDESLSKEDKHAKMKAMHDAVHAQVRDVLTDEQKPKFDAMVKDMENNMHGHDKGADHDHK